MRYVLLGDSHLTGTSSRWPTTKLPPRLRADGHGVTELAVGGLDSRAALERYTAVPEGTVVVSLGTNDAAPWKQVPLDEFEANYARLLGRIDRPGVLVLPPGPVRETRHQGRSNDEIRRYASVATRVARAAGATPLPLFDRLSALLTAGGDVHVDDGVHLNDAAYEVVHDLVTATSGVAGSP